MTRFSKSALLLGAALAVLSACSGTKGPGEIGTKEDIVVRNNGMPGAKDAKAPPPDADFSSTVEQAQAIPAPSVETAEPLPDSSPAVEAAAQQVAEAKAPVPSTAATTPVTTPSTEANRIDQIAPETPVQDARNIAPPADTTVTPPAASATATATTAAPATEQIPVQPYAAAPAPAPAPAPATTPAPAAAPAYAAASTVYPAADYSSSTATPAAAAPAEAMPAPVPAPAPAAPAPAPSENAYVPVPAGTPYPLDPDAPYSPKAMASAGVTASVDSGAAPTGGVNDPATIRAAQAALKTKTGYSGEATGSVDAAFLNALTIYQAQNQLPVGGLNAETLKHLGVTQ